MIDRQISELTTRNDRWIVVSIFFIALMFIPFLTHSLLNHPPGYDELLHVLAARGIDTTGSPQIADGVYPRAYLYTKLVSMVNQLGANELLLARIPSVVFGAFLVALLGSWITVKVGWLAGLSAAGVLAIMPDTIHLSVLIRFYTLHTLVMTVMLICIYEALEPHRKGKEVSAFIVVALVAFLLGIQFQKLSQITALGGIAAAICVVACDRRHQLQRLINSYKLISVIVLVLFLLVTYKIAHSLGVYEKLRGITAAWSATKADDIFFYVKNFTTRLPLFWPLFPVFLLCALLINYRLVLFLSTVVLVCLAINSVAYLKATRYIYHFLPAIAAIIGIGLQSAIAHISELLVNRFSMRNSTSFVVVLSIFSVVLLNSVEVQRAIKIATGVGTVDNTVPVMSEPDWTLAQSKLQNYVDTVETVIVGSGVKGLFFFGKYDFELSRTVIDNTEERAEFGHDARTGRVVISSPNSINKVLSGPGAELIVLENRMLNRDYGVSTDAVAAIANKCATVEIPVESQLTAWICN